MTETPTEKRASGTMASPFAFRPPVDCSSPEKRTSPSSMSSSRFRYRVGRLTPQTSASV